jgi:hypothetical protein
VKICSLYGAGFYYIPGTDTCLKVGGWIRWENATGYNGSMTTAWFFNDLNNRSTNNNTWRAKGTITFDAREQTAYGTLRSYAALGVSNNNNADNAVAAGYANRWFIQWAGFTIGHATSFYDFYSIGGNQYGFVTASSDTGDGGWDVFGYTAQFGNGLSATLSAEVQRRTQILNGYALAGGNVLSTNYAGTNMPDIVANIRVDQAWGSAQLMGALHQVQALYYGADETTGHPSDKIGFAIGAGLKLNAPMIGPGDYFQMEVDYTKGASRYSDNTALPFNKIKYDGTTVGIGLESDATYAAGTDLELTTTWGVNAAFTHNWTPALKSTLWGAYRQVNYNDAANAILAAGAGGVGASADFDWSMWGFGLRTEWKATKNLALGVEVLYANLDSMSSSTGLITAGSGTKPAGAYTLADQDQVALRFRATRSFVP